MNKINVGIVGHTGMVGSILNNLLSTHNGININYRQNSKFQLGKAEESELIFLATKDPKSMRAAPEFLKAGKKVIDLSGAFRIPKEQFEKWYGLEHECPELIDQAVYGMPSLNRDKIKNARLVANPGCYPTAVILPIKPLKDFHIEGPLRINATSGNSGARKSVEEISNEQTYSFGRQHKHVPEMEQYSGLTVKNFSPTVLRSVFKGINANIEAPIREEYKYLPTQKTEEIFRQRIRDAYTLEDQVEVKVDGEGALWGTESVNNTNKNYVKLKIEDGTMYMTSMIDNLKKGAAGQAIENMNIMLGFSRLKGLK